MTLRIAWFATAKGQSSRRLLNSALNAIREDELDAEIVCIVCNRSPVNRPTPTHFSMLRSKQGYR